jgi:hypothetical protein
MAGFDLTTEEIVVLWVGMANKNHVSIHAKPFSVSLLFPSRLLPPANCRQKTGFLALVRVTRKTAQLMIA